LLLKEWCEVKQRYWGLVGMLGLGLSLTLAGCGGGGGGGGSSALGSDTSYTSSVIVSTVAGKRDSGIDNYTGTNATFDAPTGLTLNASKTYLYVADTGNNAIRTVNISSKVVSTFYKDSLNGPEGLVFSGTDLYVCDTISSVIYTINSTASNVSTFVSSDLNYPTGIVLYNSYFYVADRKNNVIKVIASDGSITDKFGTGNAGEAGSTYTSPTISVDSAEFNSPYGVASDGAGYLYVTDCDNSTIRKIDISNETVTILAGTPGSEYSDDSTDDTGETAYFKNPTGITYNEVDGYLYVADTGNHIIRKVDRNTGETHTIAGYKGHAGYADGQTGNAAKFNSPTGIVSDGNGNLYVADKVNNRIRKIELQ
jgi:sugar lactone lactonase YvrE